MTMPDKQSQNQVWIR